MLRLLKLAQLSLGLAALGACARPEPARPIPATRGTVAVATPTAAALRKPAPVEWVYWEAQQLGLHPAGRAPGLPLIDAQIERVHGAVARWTELPETARELLRANGFVVIGRASPTMRLGAYYKKLAAERVPFVVTFDVLATLAHVAFSRALAEAEDREIAPALGTLLGKLDARLTAEEHGAHTDLIAAYATAHGLVAVARALADASYVAPPELAPLVDLEKKRVIAHAGTAASVLLGTSFDYAALAPRAALEETDARAGMYRAVAWLAQAPLLLMGRSESPGAAVDVGRARTHARAAMLLARLFDGDVDPDIARAWTAIARIGEFVAGAPDDLSVVRLAQVASSVGLDVRDPSAIENTVLVDKVRRAAARAQTPRIYDGAGDARPERASRDGVALLRGAVSARLLGARAASDAAVMQALVFPSVGAAAQDRSDARDAGARDDRGGRALPSALDVAAWLGSPAARLAVHASKLDAYERYDAVFERLAAGRPKDDAPERHASLYESHLDAISTYLDTSAADTGQAFGGSPTYRMRKLEVALGAWTMLRHDAVAFTRRSLGADAVAPVAMLASAPETRAFVEPAPEAIGKLCSLVKQATRGLAALAKAPKDAPSQIVLAEIDQLLTGALRIAVRETNDEPFTADDLAFLGSIPARLDALDARLARSGEADGPLVVDVHTDVGGAVVLEEAIGPIDDLYLTVREPRSGRVVLAIGAALPQYELAQPVALRLTDEAWRARLRAGSAPPRHAFASGYVIEEARGK